jgi:hypothetical protein
MPTRWAGSLRTTATSHGKTIVCIPKLVNQEATPPRYQRNSRVSAGGSM